MHIYRIDRSVAGLPDLAYFFCLINTATDIPYSFDFFVLKT